MTIPLKASDPMKNMKNRHPAVRRALGPKQGFTLLEVIIVLLLATVMMGMGLMAFASRLPTAKLDATARELSSLLRYARLQAKIQGKEQTLLIDLDARTYGMEGVRIRPIPEEVRIEIKEASIESVNKGIYPLLFSPFGSNNTPLIHLSSGHKTIFLKSDPVMGFQISRNNKK